MLKDADRIFTNIYGLEDVGLTGARKRGDWDNTKKLIELGREEIIEQVYLGRAEPMTGFINPNYPGGTLEGLEEGSYQPERALEVLEEAGYTEPVPVSILVSEGVPDAQEVAVQPGLAAAAVSVFPIPGALRAGLLISSSDHG